MRLQDLANKRVGIWGFGREGRATLGCLRRLFPDKPITVLDDRAELDAADPAVSIVTGAGVAAAALGLEVIVKAPGVSLYAPAVAAAKAKGVVITSATNLWFAANPAAKTIAITGTKGKSTTAALVHHLLGAGGMAAELRGNIGTPLLDRPAAEGGVEVFVLELSSYQLSDLEFGPGIAVLLNLFPEHIDWHGSTEVYYRDKLNIFKADRPQVRILDFADPETRRRTGHIADPCYFNAPDAIHVEGAMIMDGAGVICGAERVRLPGRHNLSNVCAALTAVKAAGLDPSTLGPALDSFRPLPHRLEVLGERGGVLYVNDSISTTPQSAAAALEVFADRPVALILGGYERRQDYGALAELICDRGVAAVLTLPHNGPRIAALVRATLDRRRPSPRPQVIEAGDLAEAVDRARLAVPPGGVVLLSPAAPSYGAFKDFEERGRAFAAFAGFTGA
ncbi:MAG: UDP-N-acetylmuramoyl-L-alanine--D-glutamate ligase [Pseudomonadota bacterium]